MTGHKRNWLLFVPAATALCLLLMTGCGASAGDGEDLDQVDAATDAGAASGLLADFGEYMVVDFDVNAEYAVMLTSDLGSGSEYKVQRIHVLDRSTSETRQLLTWVDANLNLDDPPRIRLWNHLVAWMQSDGRLRTCPVALSTCTPTLHGTVWGFESGGLANFALGNDQGISIEQVDTNHLQLTSYDLSTMLPTQTTAAFPGSARGLATDGTSVAVALPVTSSYNAGHHGIYACTGAACATQLHRITTEGMLWAVGDGLAYVQRAGGIWAVDIATSASTNILATDSTHVVGAFTLAGSRAFFTRIQLQGDSVPWGESAAIEVCEVTACASTAVTLDAMLTNSYMANIMRVIDDRVYYTSSMFSAEAVIRVLQVP